MSINRLITPKLLAIFSSNAPGMALDLWPATRYSVRLLRMREAAKAGWSKPKIEKTPCIRDREPGTPLSAIRSVGLRA